MKLYAIFLVKNEDDSNLGAIQVLSKQYDQIVPFEQTLRPYGNGLRAHVAVMT